MTKRFCFDLSAFNTSQPRESTFSIRGELTLTLCIALTVPPSRTSCKCWIGSVGCSPDSSDTMLCALVTLICGLDVPDVRLEWITTAANTHLGEVTNGILRLGQTFNQTVRIIFSIM